MEGALESFFSNKKSIFLYSNAKKNTDFPQVPCCFPHWPRLRFGLGPGNTKANLVLFHARGAVLVSLDELQKVMGGLVIQMIFRISKNWG